MAVLIHILTILFGLISFVIVKKKRYRDVPFVSFVIFFSFIGCGFVSLVVIFVPYGELLLMPLSSIVLGILCLLVLVNDFYSQLRCKNKIEGVYCGCHTYYGGRSVSNQAPVFEYTYKNQFYREQTTQTLSYRQVSKMRVGACYPIYIDSSHPSVFIFHKGLRMSVVVLFLFGLLFFVGGMITLSAELPYFFKIVL